MKRPFLLAVLIGFGTVFALSLLMIFIVSGLPLPLYPVHAWFNGSDNVLLWLLPLLSLVGYVEAGFMHAFFANRQAARSAAPDLVEEVGQGASAQSSFVGKGAVAGALAGVLASVVAMPIYILMTYMEILNPKKNFISENPEWIPLGVDGAIVAALVSLGIALVAGLLVGALGGLLGSRINPAPRTA